MVDANPQSGHDPQGRAGLENHRSTFGGSLRFISVAVFAFSIALLNACTLNRRESDRRPTPQLPELDYIGQALLPPNHTFKGTRVGGLSGLDCVKNSGFCFAISDDLSVHGPARFYTLWIDLGDNRLDNGDIRFLDVTTLLDKNGEAFAENTVDPEAIRFEPQSGTLYWTSEGKVDQGIAPFIRQTQIDGTFLHELSLPEKFIPDGKGTRGIRETLGLESLSLSTQGPKLYTATENALVQDGPAASLGQGSRARVLRFDSPEGRVTETVYATDPVTRESTPPGRFMTAGLVEILALGPNRLLTLERSYSRGAGFSARIYLAEFSDAQDIQTVESLAEVAAKPLTKHLVLDLETVGVALGNLEGMSFGPILGDGSKSLVLIADDNFNDRLSTQFLAFRLVGGTGCDDEVAVGSSVVSQCTQD